MQLHRAPLLSNPERLRREWVTAQRLLKEAQARGLDISDLVARERSAYEAYLVCEGDSQIGDEGRERSA
jgi:hypothetical protein